MIDFRYHLVSIIAVFFALAIGIVLGAGPLGERVDENLPEQLAEMRETNQQYQEQIRMLEAQQEFRDGFIAGVTPELVGGRLDNRRLALITLPGADGDVVDAMVEVFETAGATVTARIAIDESWRDPDSEAALDQMATELVSSETTLPEQGTGYDRGAALLAGAVVRPPLGELLSESPPGGVDEGTFEAASQVNQDVLDGLSGAGLIEVNGEPEIKASMAVAVSGPPPAPDEEGEEAPPQEPLTAVLTALADTAAGTVATGPAAAAAEGGLLTVVRGDDELGQQVSTVDSIGLLSGRIAVVYAVVEQADGGSGHYGYRGAEDGPVPPVPEEPTPVAPPTGTTGNAQDEDGAQAEITNGGRPPQGGAAEEPQSQDDAGDKPGTDTGTDTGTDKEGGQ